jgi:hypothetical protein
MKWPCSLAILAAPTAALVWVVSCDDESTRVFDATSPAPVTDLAVSGCPAPTAVTLQWTAPGDDGATGTASSYQLKRSNSPINAANFSSATSVPGVPSPSVAGTVESFTVAGLDSTLTHYFALRAVDEAGNTGAPSNNALKQPNQQFVKIIPPFKDNTMFEEDDLSNGVGVHIFTGETAVSAARRALLAFAVSDSVCAGAVIDSVRLTLRMSRTRTATARVVSLHRLTADWGEGLSDAGGEEGAGIAAEPGDVTWRHRFYDATLWTTSGGDFEAAASAQQSVGNIGLYTWSSPQMTADVQSWVDSPASNFGWIVIGDESTFATAKRFDSRENATAANRPRLTVYYTVP